MTFPGSTRFGLRFSDAWWLGPVRFGLFPRPVPAGSRIKRFGSVRFGSVRPIRPVRCGFFLLPAMTITGSNLVPFSQMACRSSSILKLLAFEWGSLWKATTIKIHQRGVQRKQGVVIRMMLYTSLLYTSTPIHCTPLPLHPPVLNTQTKL